MNQIFDDRNLAKGNVLLVLGALGFAIWQSFSNFGVAAGDFWLCALIGVAVGATEMMARYRDRPFLPMLSMPGLVYIGVNAGAAALAFYLLPKMGVAISPEMRILTAGLGAMAFFRSGLFTVRLGDTDVAVGPNLVLQILLQALDRSYDRQRAAPRADVTAAIMSGISFAGCHAALPAICFNLMQNVSQDEQSSLAAQADALARREDLGDDTKALVLGLALLNIVGETTLKTAVQALGKTVKASQMVDRDLIDDLAAIDPATVLTTLPRVCNAVCHKSLKEEDPTTLIADIAGFDLPDENKAVLALYKLVEVYGPTPVRIALGSMV